MRIVILSERSLVYLQKNKSTKKMKVILDLPDNRAVSLLEVLKSISFVKIETISAEKATFFNELKSSIDEVVLAKQGKIKLKSADDLLYEL